jgi:predicted nucleic acid-binding protein
LPPSDRDPPPAPASTGKQPEKPRIVVSDAGPLISLGRLDLLPLLGALFAEVQVPDVVVDECLARPDNVDAQRIRQALASGLLLRCPGPSMQLPGLQPGESAAITRALEIGAALLMDERAGRAHALALGLAVTGTLGVLVRARRRGLIGPLAPLLTALRASGQRLGDALVRQALADVGEAPG